MGKEKKLSGNRNESELFRMSNAINVEYAPVLQKKKYKAPKSVVMRLSRYL